MRRRIPSISALIAFDAVARHSSINRAADELALTESAVSRQISQLEDQLGVALFHRIKKRLSLTRAGASYARDVSRALERLEKNTFDVMANEGEGGTLEIATLPTVGALWMIPRMPQFHALHPKLAINWSSRSSRFLFSETTLDGAICFGSASWPGAQMDLLFQEELLVVASGQLAKKHASWSPEQILQEPRLHLVTRPTAWAAWSTEAGGADTNLMKGQRFQVQALLIAAACAGLGLALLPRFLIEAPLRRGELKVISPVPVKSDGAYYFAYPEEKAGEPHLQLFRSWLQGLVATPRPGTARAQPRPAPASA